MIIKPIGTELSVTTANNVAGARLIRVHAAANSIITIANTEGATIGSFTAPAGSVTIVEKEPLNTIAGTTALLCTPISYKS